MTLVLGWGCSIFIGSCIIVVAFALGESGTAMGRATALFFLGFLYFLKK
jgi:hypothetical protein